MTRLSLYAWAFSIGIVLSVLPDLQRKQDEIVRLKELREADRQRHETEVSLYKPTPKPMSCRMHVELGDGWIRHCIKTVRGI